MRPILTCLVAAGLLVGQVCSAAAAAPDPCARPVEKAAFNITGLKSQLMVTAISCQAQARYNQFVTRYRTDLVSQEKALNGYFQRTSGRSAQKAHDDYITSLANSQSQVGIKSGTLFCDRTVGLFDEVMALKDGKDLPTYAAGKALVQPIDLTECPAQPEKLAKRTRTAKK